MRSICSWIFFVLVFLWGDWLRWPPIANFICFDAHENCVVNKAISFDFRCVVFESITSMYLILKLMFYDNSFSFFFWGALSKNPQVSRSILKHYPRFRRLRVELLKVLVWWLGFRCNKTKLSIRLKSPPYRYCDTKFKMKLESEKKAW